MKKIFRKSLFTIQQNYFPNAANTFGSLKFIKFEVFSHLQKEFRTISSTMHLILDRLWNSHNCVGINHFVAWKNGFSFSLKKTAKNSATAKIDILFYWCAYLSVHSFAVSSKTIGSHSLLCVVVDFFLPRSAIA